MIPVGIYLGRGYSKQYRFRVGKVFYDFPIYCKKGMHTFHFSTLNELPNLGSHSIAADVNSLASVVINVDFLAWFSGGFTLVDFAFTCRCLGSFISYSESSA
jgi:hypothetical protein